MKGKIKYFFLRFLVGTLLPFTAFSNSDPQRSYEAFEKYLSEPNYQRALYEVGNTLLLAKAANDRTLIIKSYLGKSRMLYLFQDYDKSIATVDSALNIFKNKSIPSEEYLLLETEACIIMGDALLAKGDIEVAKAYYKKADQTLSKTTVDSPKLKARILMGWSKYHGFKTEIWHEFQYAKAAFDLADNLDPSDLYRVDILIQYANAYKVSKRDSAKNRDDIYEKVRSICKNALKEIDKITKKPSIQKANALQGLANSYADYLNFKSFIDPEQKRRCIENAKTFYIRSLDIKKTIYGINSSSFSITCYTIALIHQSTMNEDSALFWYDKAIASALGKGNDATEINDLSSIDIKDPYLLNVLLANKSRFLHLNSKKTNNYQQILEQHKVNESRLQLWRRLYSTLKSRDLGEIISKWGHAPFEEAMATAYRLFKITGDSIYLKHIFDFAEESQNNDFIYEYVSNNKTLQDINESIPGLIELEYLKSVCRKTNSIYLHITNPVRYDSLAFSILVTKNQILLHPFSPDSASLLINQYKQSLSKNDCILFTKASYGLYKLIVDPVLSQVEIKEKNMVVAPGSFLQDIPLEALLVRMPKANGCDFRKLDYLIKDYSISYTLSGSIWAYQLRKHKNNGGELVVYKPLLSDKTRLLFSESLYNKMEDKYQGLYWGENEATRERFLGDSTPRSIIHLFSHAKADRNRYENSVIYFDGKPTDSVTIGDVYNHRIESELTVLACCESSSGPANYGEGPKSLVRAFIFAGSRSVLGTIWNVDEKSTIDLLERFYRQLETPITFTQALRQAKLDYLSDCPNADMANPFYWSGLVFNGSPDSSTNLELKKTNGLIYLVVLLILSAIVLVFKNYF